MQWLFDFGTLLERSQEGKGEEFLGYFLDEFALISYVKKQQKS